MADVKLYNAMARDFVLKVREEAPNGQPIVKDYTVKSLQSIVVDADKLEKAKKGSKVLQHLLDTKRLVTAKSSGAISTPDEAIKRSTDNEKPEEFKDTANAEKGKTKHEVKSVEMVETSADDAPKGGKKSKK